MTPETFKTIRKRTGLKQSAFGRLISIKSQRVISDIETGKTPVPSRVALALAWITVFGTGDPWDDQTGFAALHLKKEMDK